MDSNSKIVVAGANGMVGSAIIRNLKEKGYTNIIPITRNEVDLTSQIQTSHFLKLINQNMSLMLLLKLVASWQIKNIKQILLQII